MNNIGNQCIKLCCEYLNIDDMDSLRKCSVRLNKAIGQYYFSCRPVNIKNINNKNKRKFDTFFSKYKQALHVRNIYNTDQLLFIKKEIESHGLLLQQLIFDDSFNCDLPNLPQLKHLTFGKKFNQPIDKLPEGLLFLKLGDNFNQPIDELPQSLEMLTLGNSFNQPMNKLPKCLKRLEFGNDFNQSVNLPPLLKILMFGINFNQVLKENSLPSSLQYLKFGNDFNKHINKDVLPNSLRILIFGNNFDQKFDEYSLPNSLKYLKFGVNFNKPINENILPESLKILILGKYFNAHIGKFPKMLEELEFGSNFCILLDTFPENLKVLVLNCTFFPFSYCPTKQLILKENAKMSDCMLPNLTHLKFY